MGLSNVKGIQACLYCSAISIGCTKLCAACWKDLEEHSTGPVFQLGYEGLHVCALWPWRREVILNRLSYGLKNLECPQTWLRLAELLVLKIGQRLDPEHVALIPAPARQIGSLDHAGRLALAISDLTGVKVLTLLQRPEGTESQKKLGRQRRQMATLLPTEKHNDLNGLRPIFVDDIVTTGSTARAAKKALGEDIPLTVLTLCCRG